MTYAFARHKHDRTNITLYSFSIKDGEESTLKFTGIEGEASSLLFVMDNVYSQYRLALGTK